MGLQTVGPRGIPLPGPAPEPGAGGRGGYDPRTDTFIPKPGMSVPGQTIKKVDSAELEQCKQDADDALDRAYDYCKALGATYNDYRTRKACEENAFRKYTKRLQECEQQCK